MLTFKTVNKDPGDKLKEKLWKVFSEYIRLRDADAKGLVDCFTCGKRLHWTQMDAGHAIPGRGNAILFDERCTKPQCSSCNRFENGRPEVFKEKLGEELYNELLIESKKVVKFSQSLLQNNIQYYSNEVKKLKG